MFRELVLKNRSYRRFDQTHKIEIETLRELVDLARCAPSAANTQPLKYILCVNPVINSAIFEHLAWAGYIEDWPGPIENERPSAYIVILEDTNIKHPLCCDHGIAAQTILLGAVEKGLGGCIIGSINREKLQCVLDLPGHLEIRLVLALGKPIEQIKLEQSKDDQDIKYWRDELQVHHVPKRSLDDIIVAL